MRPICFTLMMGLLLMINCGKTPPPVRVALPAPVETTAQTKVEEQAISKSVAKAVKQSHLKVAATPKPLPKPPEKEAMDTLEVETDTSVWTVGKTGIITVVIAEPDLVADASHSNEIGIGATLVPVSAYYLVALQGALPGQFDIAPAPGQQERQHRAPKGYPATWRYEVTPLRKGKVDLLFTLKIFAENDTAGTDISTRPLHLDVVSKFPSSLFFSLNHTITNGPGWGAVLGVVAALITALAYSTWWRSRRKSRKKQIVSKD